MSILKINHISKSVENENIISDVTLAFEDKGLVFIVGKSGAGKSTLLNIIGQLDSEYTGEVILDGQLCDKTDKQMCDTRRKQIGFVFQDFNLLGDLTVDENIKVAMNLSGCEKSDFSSYYNAFDINNCKDKQCKYMSGGERQRASLVRAICKDSHIILADEPTGNLDSNNSKAVFDALKSISSERLVIVVTHNTDAAASYGDRVITLSDGRVISDEKKIADKKSEYIVNKEKNKRNNIKRKDNLSPIVKKHLKNNRRRNAMIVTICVVLMLFSVATISLLNAMNEVNTSINAIFGNDKINVYNIDDESGLLNDISNDFVKEIRECGCDGIVEYHRLFLGVYKNNDYISLNYEVFNISDFFKERFAYYGISLPQTANEIIVNSAFAKKVFGTENCVGNTIDICIYSDVSISCKVVAVSDVLIENDKPSLYINSEIMVSLSEKTIESSELYAYSEFAKNHSFVDIEHMSNKDTVIYGSEPANIQEAVINVGGINSVISLLDLPYSFVSIGDAIDGNVSDEMINSILNSTISIKANEGEVPYTILKIVGVTNDTSDTLKFFVNENTYQAIRESKTNVVDIYLKDLKENKEKVNSVVNKYQYMTGELGSIKATVAASKMNVTMVIMAGLSIVAIVVAFMFIRFATKLSIMNQINEIGILKALGAGNKQIGSLYIKENMILFWLSACISVVCLIGLQILKLQGYLVVDGIEIYNINVIHLIIILLLGVITVCVATLFEVKKIGKLNLVDLLRKNN